MEQSLSTKGKTRNPTNIAIIVAHPDDETLWAGGTILSHPLCGWFIVCLSRAKDKDRAPRFFQALKDLHSEGIMGNLDDGPEQKPLNEKKVEKAILDLIPAGHFDLIITHNPTGEYTKHLRHEEISRAVIKLWCSGQLPASELWTFAYSDGNKAFYPKADENATFRRILSKSIWQKKYSIMTKTYGFPGDSWEAETTPLIESFWQFTDISEAEKWFNNGGILK